MEDIVLFCKSYERDVLRVKRLLDSIEKHNRDRLPVYISMPAGDRHLFEQYLGAGRVELIDDEAIVAANPRVDPVAVRAVEGRVSQAMVRSEFWRVGACRAYLCIDSDSVFLTDFGRADLVGDDGQPYTVMHQNKELIQSAANCGIDKVALELHAEIERVQSLFGRRGPAYSFAPSPFLWAAAVWQSLDDNYLKPRGQTLWDVCNRELPEYLWYGEALLAYGAIPLRPIEPLFRVYHYTWQYYALRRMGETEAKLAHNFLGVIYQSNWEYELDYGAAAKSPASRLLRRCKRGLRYLQYRWLT
jgi:hypothetical protein